MTATQDGTEKFFRFHEIHRDKRRRLDDLYVSALSIGTNMGEANDKVDDFYVKAILQSISHGINVIDTSINYRNERSERLIPRILKELKDLGVSRDQIVLTSKGGFFPIKEGVQDHAHYIRSHFIEKGIVQPGEIVKDCHCLSPTFIEHQIEHTLHNMGIDCLDLYYLHHPEFQLSELTENEFDERMYQAIETLEKMVEEKKIKRYGLSTWNGFRQKLGTKGLLDLTKYILFAENVAGENHHFKAIQLPINFVMLEAVKSANQEVSDERVTILTLAKEKKIHVSSAAPFMQSYVFKLPFRIFDALPHEMTKAHQILQFLTGLKGVDSVVVGMKNLEHVHENLKVLNLPSWTGEQMKTAKEALQ